VEARSAVLLFSQPLLHRLDAGADVLLRRRGALASLALEGGAIFGVVVGDDIARLWLPLAQAHPERSVVLDKPSRLVDRSVQVDTSIVIDRVPVPDKGVHKTKVDHPIAVPIARDLEARNEVNVGVPVLVDLPLSRRPDAVQQALAANAGQVAKPLHDVFTPELGPVVLFGIPQHGIIPMGGAKAGRLPVKGALVQPVRRSVRVAVHDELLIRHHAVAEASRDGLDVFQSDLRGLKDDGKVVLRRHHLAGVVEATNNQAGAVRVFECAWLFDVARKSLHTIVGRLQDLHVRLDSGFGEGLLRLAEQDAAHAAVLQRGEMGLPEDAIGLAGANWPLDQYLEVAATQQLFGRATRFVADLMT